MSIDYNNDFEKGSIFNFYNKLIFKYSPLIIKYSYNKLFRTELHHNLLKLNIYDTEKELASLNEIKNQSKSYYFPLPNYKETGNKENDDMIYKQNILVFSYFFKNYLVLLINTLATYHMIILISKTKFSRSQFKYLISNNKKYFISIKKTICVFMIAAGISILPEIYIKDVSDKIDTNEINQYKAIYKNYKLV